MRILLNIHIPHEPFNSAVRDGTAGQKLGRIVDEIKPEAVYFTEQHGQRGAVMIDKASLFAGRKEQVNKLINAVNQRRTARRSLWRKRSRKNFSRQRPQRISGPL